MSRMYRIGEVARLFGVSVRTLHHYDERGLLVPSARSEAGYRLYTDDDLARLVEILTLRALGLKLERIGALLARPDADPARALRLRQIVIRRQIADLEALDEAIAGALQRHTASGAWVWDREWEHASRLPRMTHDDVEEIVEKHYTTEQLAQFEQLAQDAGPEEIAAVEQGWSALLPDVRAAHQAGMDPASPEAQALGERWRALLARTFRGNTELMGAVRGNYEKGVFEDHPGTPSKEDSAFIVAVNATREEGSA